MDEESVRVLYLQTVKRIIISNTDLRCRVCGSLDNDEMNEESVRVVIANHDSIIISCNTDLRYGSYSQDCQRNKRHHRVLPSEEMDAHQEGM
jgi:predicted xylose isomerase-like sugar epimerase